jgi:hypothetical protein
MITNCGWTRGWFRLGLGTLVLGALALAVASPVVAQAPPATGQAQQPNVNLLAPYRAVGGISINANGLLQNAAVEELGQLGQLRAKNLAKLPGDLTQPIPLRKISLRNLEAAIDASFKAKKPLSDELRYLGGLQQIRYVFVYPEEKDIVLVGPAEGWKTDAKGNIVGVTTGQAVMLLDDLLVALRAERQAAQAGITCSIDPTNEGLKRLEAYMKPIHAMNGQNQANLAAGMEENLGPQNISFTGVPENSHFARVLIAADFRMKRIAMEFEKSKVVPGFLHTIPASTRQVMMPRWWLEPKYDGILRDADGLAWELRGGSVKTMTEDEFLTAAGQRERTGKASPVAQKWADTMTAKYGELAAAEPIFGQLRNCMDMAIVGAIISKENLLAKAGANFAMLYDTGAIVTEEYAVPKQVDSKVTMFKKGQNWIISASGGIAIHAWGIAQSAEKSEAPAAARSKASPKADNAKWCWN